MMGNEMFDISKLLKEYTVYIPEIQRDYAQGREGAKSVRDKLLDEIYDVLSGRSPQLVLNYIYGVPNPEEGKKTKIVLIDGQQRVTTLFLLKWYLAVKSHKTELSFLDDLSYATRESSKEFCEFLGKHSLCIEGDGRPSENITNHSKFKKRWLNDPTIFNMLNMLDAIDEKIRGDFVLFYSNLDNIKFSFISLDGFRRTEELYAAMNSRGKQLTPFELIKGNLLQADKGLASVINGEWLPAFWEISKKYAGDEDGEKYASKRHDSFLYNFYSFIIQMIWFMDEGNQPKKEESLPSIVTMTDEVIKNKENIELIKFGMSLVQGETDETFQCYEFKEIVRDKDTLLPEGDQENKVVIFDGNKEDSVDFFKACCLGEKFSQAAKCYLWAYIRYRYDSKNERISDDRGLVDYYLLMRALFMNVASNETPLSVGKLSLNEELLWKVIQPFEEIITNKDACRNADYNHLSQYNAFYSKSHSHYRILNNPIVRGVTDNIEEFSNEDNLLAANLDWISEQDDDDVECFKRLASCETDGGERFYQFRCELNGYYGRVFLPVKKMILKSLFSLRCWKESQDFKNFIEFLRKKRLSDIDNIKYTESEWQYYIINYSSFREGTYGQFYIPESNEKKCNAEMSFDASYIENERATKHKTRNPFIYEIYRDSFEKKMIDNDMKYNDFVDKYKISLKQKEDGNFEWIYNNKIYETDGSKDCIKEFLNILDNLEKQKHHD